MSRDLEEIGQEYSQRVEDLPSLVAEVPVPQGLVDDVRGLYELLQDVPTEDNPAHGRTFEQYLEDMALEQVEIELRFPDDVDDNPG